MAQLSIVIASLKLIFGTGPKSKKRMAWVGKPRTRAPNIYSDDRASLSTKAVSPKVHCVQIRACLFAIPTNPRPHIRAFGHGVCNGLARLSTKAVIPKIHRLQIRAFGHGICNGLASHSAKFVIPKVCRLRIWAWAWYLQWPCQLPVGVET